MQPDRNPFAGKSPSEILATSVLPLREQWRARRGRILAMRKSGSTLAAIGGEFGITRERVRQIVNKYG